jgi:hypothetical protein
LFYRVKAIDVNGSYTYSNIARVNKLIKNKINISPNPFVDQINIETNGNQGDKFFIQLLNSEGKLILTQMQTLQKGNNKIIVNKNLSTLPSGSYVINAFINDKLTDCKIIIK